MVWREDAAAACSSTGDMQVGVVREADDDFAQAPPITSTCFHRWMHHAASEAAAGDAGYAIGRRVHNLLTEEADDSDADVWNLARRSVAEVFGQNVLRAVHSLSQEMVAVALSDDDEFA